MIGEGYENDSSSAEPGPSRRDLEAAFRAHLQRALIHEAAPAAVVLGLKKPSFLTAATSATFTLSDIRAGQSDATLEPGEISAVLDRSQAVATLSDSDERRFRLTDRARKDVFDAWEGDEGLSQRLAKLVGKPMPEHDSNDYETRFVCGIAQDPSGLLERVVFDEIAVVRAAARAGEMMSIARPAVVPALAELRRRLDLEEIVSPLKVLISKSSAVGEGQGPDSFAARDRELILLCDHVGVLPPASWQQAFRRFRRRVAETFGGVPKGALIVHGIGGMGKSALMAKFVLEHLRSDEHWLPIAYLDFDRSALAGAGPNALFAEIVRQIALQIPNAVEAGHIGASDAGTLQKSFAEFRSALSADRELVADDIRLSHIERFRALVDSMAGRRPFLLVLDTAERIQTAGSEAALKLVALLRQLGLFEGGWRMRVVACSRLDFPDLRNGKATPEPIELKALSRGESLRVAKSILSRQSSGQEPSDAVAAAIADASKGYPLFIKTLTVIVAEGKGGDEKLLEDIIGTKGDTAKVATVLYKRFGERIGGLNDVKLSRVVLCLREIRPQILKAVISNALPDANLDADAVFESLRQDSTLWAEASATALRWRPELRSLLLACLRADGAEGSALPRRVAEIVLDHNDAAMSGRQPAFDLSDAVYYRLMSNGDVFHAHSLWRDDRALRRGLAGADHDFPVESAAAAYLRLAQSKDFPTVDQIEALPSGVAWDLAWAAKPKLSWPGASGVDERLLKLGANRSVARDVGALDARRFALAVKCGFWQDAERLFEPAVLDDSSGLLAFLHWGARTGAGRSQVASLASDLLRVIPALFGRQRDNGDHLVAALALANVVPELANSLASEIDHQLADLHALALDQGRLTTTVIAAGSFGDAAADWAVDFAYRGRPLAAISTAQLDLLLRPDHEIMARREFEELRGVLAAAYGERAPMGGGLGAAAAETRPILSAAFKALWALCKAWEDDTERRAFIRAFFLTSNADWTEPFGYALWRTIAQNRRPQLFRSTLQQMIEAHELSFEFGTKLAKNSSIEDPIWLLNKIDAASAMPLFLRRVRDHFSFGDTLLSATFQSISESLSFRGGGPSVEEKDVFIQLHDEFEEWLLLKAVRPAAPMQQFSR